MKCPVLQIGVIAGQPIAKKSDSDCLKEECAWWSEEHSQCDPTGLLPWLIHIESRLSDLVDKMPHEEQFRK